MKTPKKPTKSQKAKLKKVFREWKDGKLHSGSKDGPVVKSHKQAIAIGLSEIGLSRNDAYDRAYISTLLGLYG
jgi:hypothetical protein